MVYAELHGAQHTFEVFPSFRTVNTVEYVERFLHHVHAEYLERSAAPEAIEPVPDDAVAGGGGPGPSQATASTGASM